VAAAGVAAAGVAAATAATAAAAAELYGADPQDFLDRRKALAAAAKDAGDADAARQIAALRKPTRAAWVVNSLTRADPGASDRLASLAASLRAAEQAKDGRRLRELSAERGALIDALTGQALTAAGVSDAPAGLRDEVSATLTAALADPEVAAALAAGTLTRAAQWAGFGFALPGSLGAGDAGGAGAGDAAGAGAGDAGGAGAGDAGGGGAPEAARAAAGTPAPAPARTPAGTPAGTPAPGEAKVTRLEEARRRKGRQADGDGQRRQAEAESRRQTEDDRRRQRQAEEERRLAEEAAQAAARRREIYEDAEREVAAAATVALDAVAAEDRLEREVRDLEDRLTTARTQLADTRLRARRAETAERKARQLLGRLPRPEDEPSGR
jgi:hypothetical protein